MLVQCRRRWPSITSALGQCIVLFVVSGAGMLKRHQHNVAVRKHDTITQCCFNDEPASKTVGQHWNSIGWMHRVGAKNTTDPVIDWCWASVVDDWPALNQQWAAMLAQHWTGIWWVGLHSQYWLHRSQVLNECWPAPAMVEKGIQVKDIIIWTWLLGFFLNYILDIRILTHEKDQHTDFVSIILKRTPFLVVNKKMDSLLDSN